jgi:hypothetical protein
MERFSFALALVLGWGSEVRSEQLLFRFDGCRVGQTLGGTVIGAGDLDGDGVPEIAAGAPQDDFVTGSASVYSGATGATELELNPIEIRGLFGGSLASIGDIDGDGVPDLIVGAPFTTRPEAYGVGSVLVFSGASGNLLYNFLGTEGGTYMGWSVAGLGDLDGDGIPEIAIGTPYASVGGNIGVGNVAVRSGATGELIYLFEGQSVGDFLGWSVAGIGDLDGDGVSDVLLGAPNASPSGLTQAGIVEVRSGATGELLYRIEGAERAGYFGKALASVGDIDGDGIDDFVVGAPEASPEGRSQAGSAFLFSGVNGHLLHRFDGSAAFDEFGASVAGGGDVDGDGTGDIAIGSPSASPGGRVAAGTAFVFSGRTQQILLQIDGESRGDSLGRSVAIIGDLRGEGRAAVAFGAPYVSPKGIDGAGSVYVWSY